MSGIFISVAAAPRALLTVAERRKAAGLAASDGSRDAELLAADIAIADFIAIWCSVAGDGLTPPTLLRETLIETFYPASYPDRLGQRLMLSRQFIGTTVVVEDGTTLVEGTDYTVNKGTGVLTRRSSGNEICWTCATSIVVTYQAGFAAAPGPVADVAKEMLARRTGAARDPLVKSESIETAGIETVSREFWVNEKNDTDLTPDMRERLRAYVTPSGV